MQRLQRLFTQCIDHSAMRIHVIRKKIELRSVSWRGEDSANTYCWQHDHIKGITPVIDNRTQEWIGLRIQGVKEPSVPVSNNVLLSALNLKLDQIHWQQDN